MAEKYEAQNPPNQEQDVEIFSGPAMFANKSYVTVTPVGLRLTFVEVSPEGHERFRAAVFLNHMDAIALHALMGRIQEGIKVSLEEMVPEPEAPPAKKAAKAKSR